MDRRLCKKSPLALTEYHSSFLKARRNQGGNVLNEIYKKRGQVVILINLPSSYNGIINNYFTNGLGTKYIGLPYTVLQTVAPAR
jgi:hypothetical protein